MLLIEHILNILAPHECIQCDREGSLLCSVCMLDACPSVPERCFRCKKLMHDFATCTNCRRNGAPSHVWVRTEYLDTAKRLVYDLKFKSARAAVVPIARLTTETLPNLPLDTLIVPIPTATKRRRQRGFDHTALLARELSKRTGLSWESVLARSDQKRQVGASREQRISQLADSFMAKKTLNSTKILLVDDIVTTGGTLESAARELRRAGASRVDAIVFAQK